MVLELNKPHVLKNTKDTVLMFNKFNNNNGNFDRKHERIFRSGEKKKSIGILCVNIITHIRYWVNRFNEHLGYDWQHIAHIHSCTHPIFINVSGSDGVLVLLVFFIRMRFHSFDCNCTPCESALLATIKNLWNVPTKYRHPFLTLRLTCYMEITIKLLFHQPAACKMRLHHSSKMSQHRIVGKKSV